jgi:hypothetical protein
MLKLITDFISWVMVSVILPIAVIYLIVAIWFLLV